jgi:hypothetical protein
MKPFHRNSEAGFIIIKVNLTILNTALQLHGAPGHYLNALSVNAPDCEIGKALQPALLLLPPYSGLAFMVAVDNNLLCTSTGLTNSFFIGLTQVYPQVDVIGQIPDPQIRLVIGAQAFGKTESLPALMAKAIKRTMKRRFVSEGCCATVKSWL